MRQTQTDTCKFFKHNTFANLQTDTCDTWPTLKNVIRKVTCNECDSPEYVLTIYFAYVYQSTNFGIIIFRNIILYATQQTRDDEPI